jgi:protein-S-isoprenylcysteine O-methyltransferase Ste14
LSDQWCNAMPLLVRNLLFTLVVPGTVAVYIPLLITPDRSPAPMPVRAVAILLLVAGSAVYAWCVWDFAIQGRGTPAPIDAPKKLVVRGLYRYTRNPMYLGVLTVILGWAVLFRSAMLLAYALAVASCFHLFVVFYEERRLHREFGGEYDLYRARVARWLPRPARRQHT